MAGLKVINYLSQKTAMIPQFEDAATALMELVKFLKV